MMENLIQILGADEYKKIVERGDDIAKHNQELQRQVFFDKKYQGNFVCPVPWDTMGVTASGDVFICLSPAWVTRFTGNILTATDIYSDVLNTETAQKIRQEILSNRYYYCNALLCSYFKGLPRDHYSNSPVDPESLYPMEFVSRSEYQVNQIPKNLIFDFDVTCNYRCPSCRTKVINNNKHPTIRPLNDAIAHQIKHLIFDNIEDQPISIRWAGGEPFISDVYLELMQYCVDLNKKNIFHVIQTNGSYLKSKADLVTYLLPYIQELRISFDAARESTYRNVRVNGVWSLLLDNVRWIVDLADKTNSPVKITADFVVQEDNYREIPEFASLCNDLGIRKINYQGMWNWNTWPEEELRRRSVWTDGHPKYQEVLDLISEARSIQSLDGQ